MTEQKQDPKDALEGMIKALAEGRFALDFYKRRTEEANATLQSTVTWGDWDHAKREEQEQYRAVCALEAETRTMALEVALELHIKDLQGVTVVARRTFEIVDPDKATAWAKANMPEALVLDHRAFEKMVLARPGGASGVPGVVYDEEEYGAARIDRDLSRYLAS